MGLFLRLQNFLFFLPSSKYVHTLRLWREIISWFSENLKLIITFRSQSLFYLYFPAFSPQTNFPNHEIITLWLSNSAIFLIAFTFLTFFLLSIRDHPSLKYSVVFSCEYLIAKLLNFGWITDKLHFWCDFVVFSERRIVLFIRLSFNRSEIIRKSLASLWRIRSEKSF